MYVPQYGDCFESFALHGKVWVLFAGIYPAEQDVKTRRWRLSYISRSRYLRERPGRPGRSVLPDPRQDRDYGRRP
jgi:hypothetical protein